MPVTAAAIHRFCKDSGTTTSRTPNSVEFAAIPIIPTSSDPTSASRDGARIETQAPTASGRSAINVATLANQKACLNTNRRKRLASDCGSAELNAVHAVPSTEVTSNAPATVQATLEEVARANRIKEPADNPASQIPLEAICARRPQGLQVMVGTRVGYSVGVQETTASKHPSATNNHASKRLATVMPALYSRAAKSCAIAAPWSDPTNP
jgi:hypothetical protein